MTIHFYKYQGTGNDFIIVDNRQWSLTQLATHQIKLLCDRRLGIGADGLMLLNPKTGYDFEMKYYNADGRESSMCGNGGRCLVKFADHLGIRKDLYRFVAIDGVHEATLDKAGTVNLKMRDVETVGEFQGDYILNTGSPHYVKMVSDVMDYDVYQQGMDIRYSPPFAKEGINVNFVEQKKDGEITVRTYERGVEDETLSCGTGVTACALVCEPHQLGHCEVTVHTKGGGLVVKFDRLSDQTFTNIWLCGPAEEVFVGQTELRP
jgi:diaminopimelate epimerase